MKLGIIGDIHLAVSPPGRRTETYLDDVKAKLTEIATEGDDVDAWLLIGDLLHHKNAARTPPALLLWVWDWLGLLAAEVDTRGRRRPVYVVPGNHDLADGSIESLARQPLAILGRHPDVHICHGIYEKIVGTDPLPTPHPMPLVWTDHHIMAVPGTGEVCDAKVPADDLFAHDVEWVAAHAPIDVQARPWATYDANALPLAARTRGIIYGHQHDQARAFRRPDGKLVIATGAISRGSVAEANHAPAWVVLDTETEAVDVRPIRCARPAAEVFRWAERTTEAARDDAMTAFTAALGAETLEGFSREGLIAGIAQRTDLPEPVRSLAVSILETAG